MKRLVLSHHAHLFLCDFILNTELTVLPIIIVDNYYYYNYVLYDLVPLYLIPMMNNFSHFIIQRCLWNAMLNSYNVNDPIFFPSIFTVFTPRVVSTAVARYNFAARDMRELSLREGDIVKIYSKIGGDQGWWKGEANGRVSKPRKSAILWVLKSIRVTMDRLKSPYMLYTQTVSSVIWWNMVSQ